MLLNIYLAQTLTIAPAKNLIITPFAAINCMINITDDLSAHTSMFQAEINAAKQLQESILNTSKNSGFAFTIMDELFHGTNAQEGSYAARMFTKNIGCLDNSLLCVATHFKEVTELEKEIPGFSNHHVKASRDESTGSWYKPYRLFEGASSQTNALALLYEQGIMIQA